MAEPDASPLAPPSAESGATLAAPLKPGPPAFLDSILNQALVVIALVALAVVQNGYVALRFDHVVQLPYLLMDQETGLFARDWYLQSDPHDKIRFFHLLLIRLASVPLGLEGGLLALYAIFMGATFWIWMAIARRLFGSASPGVVVGLLAIFFNGWELGANQLAENIFIPRMEAYAFSYAGLWLLLAGRPTWGGLAFAIGGLFQPAVPLQFAGVLALWILIAGERPRLVTFIKFSAAYWIVSLPWMLYLRGSVTGESNLTSEEIIRIFAFVRHPAHMIPSTWTIQRWVMTAVLLAWFAVVWARRRERDPAAWQLGIAAPLIVALLVVSLVFIEIIPVKWVVLFQPFRASVLLYVILFLVLAPEIVSDAQSDSFARRVRAASLVVAVTDLRWLAPALLFQLVLKAADRRGRSVRPALEIAVWLAMGAAVAFLYPWVRKPFEIGVVFAVALAGAQWRPALGSSRGMRATLAGIAVIAFAAVGVFRVLPWERWMLRGEGGRYNAIDRLLMDNQLKVISIPGIERLGEYVREHTPQDALFLIPPGRNQWGFRLFARRAQVFDVKSIPYDPPGIEEWWRRSLQHRGIFDPKDPANTARLQRAWDDENAAGIGADYAALAADDILRLAELYEADYIITPTMYDDPRFGLVHSVPAPEQFGSSKTLYLYQAAPFVPESNEAPTG